MKEKQRNPLHLKAGCFVIGEKNVLDLHKMRSQFHFSTKIRQFFLSFKKTLIRANQENVMLLANRLKMVIVLLSCHIDNDNW